MATEYKLSFTAKEIDDRLRSAGKIPQDFGAKGDGETDDHEAFQECIDYCEEHNEVMYIPAGTYVINTPILIPDYVKIEGSHVTTTTLKGSGDYIFKGSAERNYKVEIENIRFEGSGSNIAIYGGFGYSKFTNLAFTGFSTCCDFLYGTWITKIRDIDGRDSNIVLKFANEANAIEMRGLSMEDITGYGILINNSGRNITITNSRFERCSVVIKASGSSLGLLIDSNYFEANEINYWHGSANYQGVTTISNNYYMDGEKNCNGYICLINTAKSKNVDGGRINIIGNTIRKYPDSLTAHKPIAFINPNTEEYKYCDQAITFEKNYFSNIIFHSYVDLVDFTNCSNYMTTYNKVIINTDLEIMRLADQPTLHFTTVKSAQHDLKERTQRYRVSGYITTGATVSGNSNYTYAFPDRRLMSYDSMLIVCTVVYTDNTVGVCRGAINDKIYVYGLDTTKIPARIYLDTEYDYCELSDANYV